MPPFTLKSVPAWTINYTVIQIINEETTFLKHCLLPNVN